jgi:threonine dehydrogenase-like Zn-dependent dehydrogenase
MEILEGTLGYYQSGQANYPIVPGHEFSGEIVALGSRVQNFTKDDKVVVECIQGCGECDYCKQDNAILCNDRTEVGVMGKDGACAEYFVTHSRYVHKVPGDVSLIAAALAEPLAVVTKALRRLGVKEKINNAKNCAVFGAGTIGHLMAQLLRLKGHTVTVFDKESERLNLFNGKISTSAELENLEKFEYLIEATGNQHVLSKILSQSTAGATILLLGLPYANQQFNFESIVAYDKTVVGSVGSSGKDFEEALKTLPQIDISPFVKSQFKLNEFTEAIQANRSHADLKIMLRINLSDQ